MTYLRSAALIEVLEGLGLRPQREHSFDSWYHIRCTDEVRESNRMTDGVPGGAHPTAGAPSSYLEDEAR